MFVVFFSSTAYFAAYIARYDDTGVYVVIVDTTSHRDSKRFMCITHMYLCFSVSPKSHDGDVCRTLSVITIARIVGFASNLSLAYRADT